MNPMLKLTRTVAGENPASLSVEDTGVVSVYRKSPVYVDKVYWRANPKANDALVSLDISEVGEILNFELLTYNGRIRAGETLRPSDANPGGEHIVWVSTECWRRPESARGMPKTAWRYADCDVPVRLSLGKHSLCVSLGDAEPRTFIRMTKCLGFGLDDLSQITVFYVDDFVGAARDAFIKRYGSLLQKA